MGSGESVQVCVSMHFDTAQLMVQVHLPLMGREVEFQTSWVNPWPSWFSTCPVFLQQSDCWHQEHQRSHSRAALFCWLQKCQAQRGWPGLFKSNLSITSCGSQPMSYWVAGYQILWEDRTVHDLWAIQQWLQLQRVDGNRAEILLHYLACNSLAVYNFPIGEE